MIEREMAPPQREVLEGGYLSSGFPAVLKMPTGAGKTWLAEQEIRRTLESGYRAVYDSPLRALAAELGDRWAREMAPH